MAPKKERTVYFFEPIMLDQDDNVQTIEAGFWNWVHARVARLPDVHRRAEIFGRRHVGTARQEVSPALDFIYIGRLRPGADWPDVSDEAGEIGSLASTGFAGSLLEPAYLLGVGGTNYVAMMRSSAGPTTTSVVRWLNQVCGFNGQENRLELRPYVRRDQLERLSRARQASKIHLKVDPGVMSDANPRDELGQALKTAQSAGAGGASVELTISFGNARPTDGAGEDLIAGVRELLASRNAVPFKKASATVMVENEDGELARDKIDFALDRVTVRQQIGTNEDEEPTPPVVLSAMAQAIDKFRQQL
ncbi:MAG: hypothetical protein ACTH31_13805 [Pseudoclavibacter sp.]